MVRPISRRHESHGLQSPATMRKVFDFFPILALHRVFILKSGRCFSLQAQINTSI
jgi:hypothetical protein